LAKYLNRCTWAGWPISNRIFIRILKVAKVQFYIDVTK